VAALTLFFIMKSMGLSNLDKLTDFDVYIPVPFVFGLNYQAISSFG